MRSANRSRAKPPPTRSGAACSGKKSNSPSSSPDAINRPLTRIRHGDSRHRNRNAQYLVGPSSKDFQALRLPEAELDRLGKREMTRPMQPDVGKREYSHGKAKQCRL